MSASTEGGYCVLTSCAKLTGIMMPFINYRYYGRHLMVEDALTLQFGGSIRSAKTAGNVIPLLF